MSFTEKLSEAVSKSVKTISNKSSNMVEISKMNLSIRKREKEIEEIIKEIGYSVYNQLRKSQALNLEEINRLIQKIQYLEKDVETLEKMIFKMQDIKYCDFCKEVYDEEVSYCPFCGKYIKG